MDRSLTNNVAGHIHADIQHKELPDYNQLLNTISHLAKKLLKSLNVQIRTQSMQLRIKVTLRRSRTENAPSLSHAAVTVIGIKPSGVAIANPAPVLTIMQEMQEQNSLRIPSPLTGTTRILITHRLDTMLKREGRTELLTDALVDLVSLARKPGIFQKHSGYFLSWRGILGCGLPNKNKLKSFQYRLWTSRLF